MQTFQVQRSAQVQPPPQPATQGIGFQTAFAPVLASAAAMRDGHSDSPVRIDGSREEERVLVTLTTSKYNFRLVSIAGEIYPLYAHEGLVIDAPLGTPVYAADNSARLQPEGALLLSITAGQGHRAIVD
jgi:murein DD-endopeptidase MepM/ murein hydrolase activator NlpD